MQQGMDIIYSIDPIPDAIVIDGSKISFASFYDMLFYFDTKDNKVSCISHTTYAEYFALEGYHIDYAVHLN